jgi:hypothetical protein
MDRKRTHVLVVDDAADGLTRALSDSLALHEVEVARDAFEAIYRIDCATRPYDVIFCDLARGDIPGPELWSYLSITRAEAARRMVFVASGPLRPETRRFLARTGNPYVELPRGPTGTRHTVFVGDVGAPTLVKRPKTKAHRSRRPASTRPRSSLT